MQIEAPISVLHATSICIKSDTAATAKITQQFQALVQHVVWTAVMKRTACFYCLLQSAYGAQPTATRTACLCLPESHVWHSCLQSIKHLRAPAIMHCGGNLRFQLSTSCCKYKSAAKGWLYPQDRHVTVNATALTGNQNKSTSWRA